MAHYKPGRYSIDTADSQLRLLMAERYGELFNENKPWDNESTDAFLNGYQIESWYYYGPSHSFQTGSGRSMRSIATKLWKMGVCYGPEEKLYHPDPRGPDLSGTPYTPKDLQFIRVMLSPEGRKKGGSDPRYMGRVLRRNVDCVMSFICAKRKYFGFMSYDVLKPKIVDAEKTKTIGGDLAYVLFHHLDEKMPVGIEWSIPVAEEYVLREVAPWMLEDMQGWAKGRDKFEKHKYQS